tara:strand:+ start:661 stop:1233 length:573 start_codon:yes stop_codon:yes gene_type:complete
MFTNKKNYYLYIEDIKVLNLNLIKKRSKFSVIYRSEKKEINFNDIISFRKECRKKAIDFYVANNLKLAMKLKATGIYISAYNKKINYSKVNNINFKVIGSAHNFKEIYMKKKQGCDEIILSRLFKTNYPNKKSFLGVTKFNLFCLLIKKNFIPLGGIRLNNLGKIKLINTKSMAFLSETKKKPAIISRLF